MNLLLSTILSFFIIGFLFPQNHIASDKEVRLVVEKAMNAIYNTGDLKVFDECIHEDYILWINNKDQLIKLSKSKQKEFLQNYTEAGQFPNYFGVPVSVKFKHVEVAGHAAMVIQDFYKGDVHTCFDHIALYKFESGWKIISWTTYTDENK